MRKETLLAAKRAAIDKAPWYVRYEFSDDVLRTLSLKQLETLVRALNAGEKRRENSAPFVALSANEVLQKETRRIAYMSVDGVDEETYEECRQGAARMTFDRIMRELDAAKPQERGKYDRR